MTEKTCSTCGVTKALTEFYRNHKQPDGHLKHCKTCFKAKYGEGIAARSKQCRKALQDIKMARGCADCGYNKHPAALQFDHLPEHVKLMQVSMMGTGVRKERLEAEIAKCEVVCANCHAVRTAERRVKS